MSANYSTIKEWLDARNVRLIAVSKTKPVEAIRDLMHAGQLDFGENRAQELKEKQAQLPGNIRWHMIGHLQKNKVKYIAAWVTLIQSVDSFELLAEINKYGVKYQRIIPCLLQVHIAKEETKFGFDENEIKSMLTNPSFSEMKNISICGLMGMATFTENMHIVSREFRSLKTLFDSLKKNHFPNSADFTELSMGMSSDYEIAVEEGATMVRIGSLIFGKR